MAWQRPLAVLGPGARHAVIRLATIDVGTNTTLLLVVQVQVSHPIRVLENRAEVTRLGRGIGGDGRLGAPGISATLLALRQFADAARSHGAEIVAVGTEGLRRATNAQDFLQPAAQILGVPVVVIDGQREAALTFLAAERSFPELGAGDAPLVVIDIGGGSTEIVIAQRGQVLARTSLPLGSVRLTERHMRHDPPLASEIAAVLHDINGALDGFAWPASGAHGPRPVLIGTAGTVTALASIALALKDYDPELVHGYRLAVSALDATVARLGNSTQREREAIPGLDPKRADVILGGACILLAIARRVGADEIVVNDRGIRWGLVYERI